VKLSLACGNRVPEGFEGVDVSPKVDPDHVVDLLSFPWPWEDESVDEIECFHFIEHIPLGTNEAEPFFQFFDEMFRIMAPATFDPNSPNIPLTGFATIEAPYYTSMRATMDPTHRRFISEGTFLYLNRKWRADNKLEHYPVDCDFDYTYSYNIDGQWALRSQETQAFAFKHYANVIDDIRVTLVKTPR